MRSVLRRHAGPVSALACCESLEQRRLLAAVAIDTTQVVRTISGNFLGTNLAWWDGALNTTQTRDLVMAAGLTSFRFPGGSSSDEFHFAKAPEWSGKGTAATFAQFIQSVGGQGMVTLNYGTGSPQEAAAFLAYLNAPASSTVSLGTGQQWDPSTSRWVQKDWHTAGYWANVRASAPLASDDGLNFLRISHPSPFGFRYFEVGNEVMGSWETDMHGSGGDSGRPHDAATYIAFAKQVASYAQQIDPAAVVSIVVDGNNSWTTSVLQQAANQGYTPKAVSDHTYMQAPGRENDTTLLMHTVADPASGFYWPAKATYLRNALANRFGSDTANSIEVLETEFNSVYSNPGKQSTSLVNGLFLADSIGSLLTSGYDGGWMWDLRNGWDTGNNNSSGLYGWRQGGDYGLLGSGSGPAPATGYYVPYPTYFAEQLAARIVAPGSNVVHATSNDPYLSIYAIRETNGHLGLLVINKDPAAALSANINLSGFTAGSAQFWQYGKAEDTAQSQTSDGHASLTSWTSTVSGSSFSQSFPSYSMTVIDLEEGMTPSQPTPLSVDGTQGNDTITITAGSTSYIVQINGAQATYSRAQVSEILISGLGGNDLITLMGDIPNVDISAGAGDDTINGGLGAELVRGDDGNDLISGNGGDDTLYGNQGDDTILGGVGSDSIMGAFGFDSITGGLGDDRIYGGDQSDTIFGDEGNDYIEGKGKADTIHGGVGNDTIWGGAGNDSILAEDGNDWIDLGYYTFSDTVDGGGGNDSSSAGDGNDVLTSVEDILA